jgi:hypothetical protein
MCGAIRCGRQYSNVTINCGRYYSKKTIRCEPHYIDHYKYDIDHYKMCGAITCGRQYSNLTITCGRYYNKKAITCWRHYGHFGAPPEGGAAVKVPHSNKWAFLISICEKYTTQQKGVVHKSPIIMSDI